MRRRMIRGLIMGVVGGVAVCDVALAAKKDHTAQPAAVMAQPAASAPAPGPGESAEDHAMKAWLEKLNGTTWSLELRPSGAKEGGPQQDTVTFEGRRVVSTLLMGEGYGGSNFTLTVGDDETATWETMQANTGGDMVLWRGEVRGETMSGVLSKQPAQGDPVAYSFTGTKRILQVAPASAAPARARAPVSP